MTQYIILLLYICQYFAKTNGLHFILMTIEDIRELIKIDETRTIELKKTTGEIKDGMHSLCAMLNSDGGYVLFGIAPKTLKIIGQMVSDNTRQEIAREIRKLEPFVNMTVAYVDVPDSNGLQVIVLHADKHLYREAPYVYNGRPYYKLESTTVQMPQQMYEEMLRQRDADKFRWDAMVAEGMTIDDLDEKRIRTAIMLGVRSGRLSPDAEGETIPNILSKLGLIKDGKPTHAAIMLFAKDTSDYPIMELKMGFFRGKDRMVFIDNKMESGNFFELHNAGMSFLFRNLRLSGEVKGLLREEKLEIPVEALREALTNSLCHRQYERTDGSVSLSIYDDRVEIINPGKFPPQLNAITIKQPHESYPHNKLIAQVLYLTTFLEKWGSGAKRIIELCREQGVDEPEWIINNDTVSIVFKRPIIDTELYWENSTIEELAQNLSMQVKELIICLQDKKLSKREMLELGKLSCKSRVTLENNFIAPAIKLGLVTMLYPNSPRHPKQKYSLTVKGYDCLNLL